MRLIRSSFFFPHRSLAFYFVLAYHDGGVPLYPYSFDISIALTHPNTHTHPHTHSLDEILFVIVRPGRKITECCSDNDAIIARGHGKNVPAENGMERPALVVDDESVKLTSNNFGRWGFFVCNSGVALQTQNSNQNSVGIQHGSTATRVCHGCAWCVVVILKIDKTCKTVPLLFSHPN